MADPRIPIDLRAAGQRILAENVWRVLEPILRKKLSVTGRD